jgi:hypothetical protein
MSSSSQLHERTDSKKKELFTSEDAIIATTTKIDLTIKKLA